ncbi:MAG: hypothetical protein LKK19_01715 [Bacteroidales bacterium]|nr:hypothetical protein [Bacteroidales bacterium]MCI2121404.1 hypothetical protein [Bacteroidales bacterium]MCI2146232.1 hypothetical protein [Bacteroidales bacterium]
MKKTVYYTDPIHDDFAGTNIKTKKLCIKYKYIHAGLFWRIARFFIYDIFARPLVFMFTKLVFSQRTVNKKVLKKSHGSGFYLYGNHTNVLLDAYGPNIICFEKRNYIIVGPDIMSISGMNNVMEMLGAIPVGATVSQKSEMHECVLSRIRQGNTVTIYPESHIWPYYNGIRPFSDASFHFPAIDHKPVYALTNCYQKRKIGRFPKVITFVDGPFYADDTKSIRENMEMLHDLCFNAMRYRTGKYSTYEYVRYVRKTK